MNHSTSDPEGPAPLGGDSRPGQTHRRREVGRTGARFGSPAMRRRLQDDSTVLPDPSTPASEPAPEPGPAPVTMPTPAQSAEEPGPAEAPGDEVNWGEPEEGYSLVRPYAWTGGRTEPAQELAMDTLVSATTVVAGSAERSADADLAVAALCAEPRAVAEVAARLRVPLGVARVLLSDMAERGMIRVHRGPLGTGESPPLEVLQRVRDGLCRL
ncbi:MAG TPA: DUF742 domain-containing protein [Pseudonocardiaceae bacterium]|nr:DUF742 domain-containing protein [Pseudonocardiaceae bacterium]